MFAQTQSQRANRLLFSGIVALLLTACGGGGGGSTGPTTPTNNPPTANAGADQSSVELATITMAGSGSDSDGGTLSYAWSQVSGPTVSFASSSDPATDVALPFVAVGTTADIVLRLTVSDGQGGSASDDVMLSVASTDYVLFTARQTNTSPAELFHYDPQTAATTILNGTLAVGGNVRSYTQSPDGASVAYIADQDTVTVDELYVAAIDGSGVVKINAPLAIGINGDVSQFQWSPDSTQIVYAADADLDDITEIYLADRDGGNHRKINGNTANGTVELTAPTWSPDGRYIAQFVRDPVTVRTVGVNIHDIQVGGFNSTRITNVPTTGTINSARWSPDSTVFSYVSDSDTDDVFELYAAAPDGSGQQKLSGTLIAGGNVNRFAWSADGTRIAYWADQNVVSQIDLFTVNPDGSSLTQINATLPTDGDVFFAQWAPQSNTLAYLADDLDDNLFRLFTANADGSNVLPVNVPAVAGGSVVSYTWSPNGQRLSYLGDIETVNLREVFAVNADGTAPSKLNVPVAANGGVFFSSGVGELNQWSPDSTMFAYPIHAFTDDIIEIFVAEADGTNNTQVSRTPPAGGNVQTFPSWSNDGTALIYVSRQNDVDTPELFLASPDGMSNMAISGAIMPTGAITRFSWSR